MLAKEMLKINLIYASNGLSNQLSQQFQILTSYLQNKPQKSYTYILQSMVKYLVKRAGLQISMWILFILAMERVLCVDKHGVEMTQNILNKCKNALWMLSVELSREKQGLGY